MMWIMFLAAAAAIKPADLKTFTDWTVGCDNGRACHATSLMPEDGDFAEGLFLSIERGAEANAQPVITLLGEPDTAARLRTVGKKPIRLIKGGPGPDWRVDARDTATLLAAIRTDAEVAVEDARGKDLGNISLAGVRAALLFMDDAQKRVGTVTALSRPGPRPASAVPPPPPLPVVQAIGRKMALPFRVPPARIAALRKAHDCEASEGLTAGYEVSQDGIDANHVIVLLGCGAGAYNFSSVAFIATRSGNRIDVVPARYDFPPNSGEGLPMLVNAAWEDGAMGSFSKARGLGDCGTFADYAWDGQRLRLTHMAEMGECRGSHDYITTWRVKVVR
jgi:hypothetical protein